jgi:hypothetical protein
MWPYTDDEAGWLTPREQAERTNRCSANDNDPGRRLPPRPAPEASPVQKSPARKSEDET